MVTLEYTIVLTYTNPVIKTEQQMKMSEINHYKINKKIRRDKAVAKVIIGLLAITLTILVIGAL